jgi:hypothetical protein
LNRDEHLTRPGPKRILALEGGGVRGIISLAFLERIEALLAERSGLGSEFRLRDYFDLIGGTSTGSLIATGLALGFSVRRLVDIYLNLSRRGFRGARWHGGVLIPKFRTRPLVDVLREQIGEITLGSEQLTTGLAIVAKRIDTGSVWIFHNHPRGVYFGPASHDAEAVPNRDLPLVNLVRASTAAPTFFAPEVIEIARGVKGAFVDGGVSPHNNPSLLLLMLASLGGYGFNWPLGPESLLLCSVGTGAQPIARHAVDVARMSGASLALESLMSMMHDCNWLNQTLLQWLSVCPTPWAIDSEIGDVSSDHFAGRAFLHYLRYNIVFDRAWLESQLSLDVSDKDLAALIRMDRPELAQRLLDLGRAAAVVQVKDSHLPACFDVRPASVAN